MDTLPGKIAFSMGLGVMLALLQDVNAAEA